MPFRPDHLDHFETLGSLTPPRLASAVAALISLGIGIGVAFLLFAPWVQTALGSGQVTALDPADRVQSVTALVPGRIDRWFVTDGSTVKKGDPIARIVDNDPLLLDRLRNERAQVVAEVDAATYAMQTAQLDVDRTRALYAEGLAARREFEAAQVKVAEHRAKVAEKRASLARVDVNLNRQSAQVVRAPRDGRILTINPANGSTLVAAGAVLATFAPEDGERVVEIYVDGRDVPLIHPGRRVRLQFEGWPAIQASGWPAVARGMFDGRVRSIDVSASPNGLFRLLVEPAPDRPPWPREPFVRLGAKVRGWVMMETVSVGYELWRQLNDFPLSFTMPVDDTVVAKAGKART